MWNSRNGFRLLVPGLIGALATGCPSPPPAGPLVLLNEESQCLVEGDSLCRIRSSFTPTLADRTISVSILGSVAGARPQVVITDALGNTLVEILDPRSSTSTANFTNTNVTIHTIIVTDNEDLGADFTISVQQN